MHAPSTVLKSQWPPNYIDVYLWRKRQAERLMADPHLLAGAKEYYRWHIGDFVTHWCDTFDPRNALSKLPSRLPFVLFQRQAECLDFLFSCLVDEESGLIDKSRDMGVTWLCCCFAVGLWCFSPGVSIGFGSRKEALVDKLGDIDSIFEKLRMVVRGLPRFFRPAGFEGSRHLAFMKIINPETGASITGEAGDNIGRGGRKSIYFVDEAAWLERAESIEAALTDNTRVRIDVSTTAGIGTIFDRKRETGYLWTPHEKPPKAKLRVFVFDWSDHPAKNEAWHAARETSAREQGLLSVFRQEVDRDPTAALAGIIIPGAWVRAAIDAHLKLKLGDDGLWLGALDVADEGGDTNAFVMRKGIVLRSADEWGEGDTGFTTRRTVGIARDRSPLDIQYDCVGVGAGVKAEVNRLQAEKLMPAGMWFVPWNAGATVLDPERRVIDGDAASPLNKDFYANLKAQAWWALRRRFELTYRALTEVGFKCNPSDLISLDSSMPRLHSITRELSQPVMTRDGRLRLLVDKKPDGARSPNLGDAIVKAYFPLAARMHITPEVIQRFSKPAQRFARQ